MGIIGPENRSLHTSVGQKRDWGAPGRSEASRSALFPTLPPACRQCDGGTRPLAQQALDLIQRTASTRHHFPAPSNTMHRRPSAAARSETFTTPSLLLYSSLDSPCSRTRSPGRAISPPVNFLPFQNSFAGAVQEQTTTFIPGLITLLIRSRDHVISSC